MDVTAALKSYAEQKASKLLKYYDRIQEIEVIFDSGKDDSASVEIIVNAEHRNMFIVRSGPGDAYAGVDECVGRLERQLSDHKKKFRNRKHTVGEDKREIRSPATETGEI